MSFQSEINERFEEGKRELTNNIKLLLFEEHPAWCELLDFEDDQIFFEPLLYSYYNFAGTRLHIPQILYGYIAPSLRPSTLRVQADHQGIIYLPNYGYLQTTQHNKTLDLCTSDQGHHLEVRNGSTIVSHKKIDIHYVPGTSTEILQFSNISFSNFFDKSQGIEDANVNNAYARHATDLEKAFTRLRENFSYAYDMITEVTKKVVLYNNSLQRSFASMKANGTGFLNTRPGIDEVFLLEDITHQCGHVVYYYVLWNKVSYFKSDIHTPLQQYTKNLTDKRSLIGAFNSLLPFAFSNLTSSACRHNNAFSGGQRIEFEGRFAFRMHKFLMDIQNFDNRDIFTEEGWHLYQLFQEVAESIYKSNRDIIERFDISNLGYEFDMTSFMKLNQQHFQTMPI